MKATKRVLICGAGIAGPAVAFWLRRFGFSLLIVERARQIRDGGQNVDIKGAGQGVVKKMALAERIEAKNTLEIGHKCVDATGRAYASYPKGAIGSLTSDFEILRGDLAAILHEETMDTCEYRFGTWVTALDERETGVMVTFNDGGSELFELVICAEGIASPTREIVFPEQTKFRYLGVYMSFFTIARQSEDDRWALSMNGIGGTSIWLRPGRTGETTVLVTFLVEEGERAHDLMSSKELLKGALVGRGTLAARLLSQIDGVKDFYFGPMSQVQVRTWSKGRFVLLGDAAYCPTPFTGQGTALALVGAYVLAGELASNVGYAEAYRRYEEILRPYVDEIQAQLSPRMVKLLHVRSRVGISIMHFIQKIFASRFTQSLMRLAKSGGSKSPSETFSLPDYSCDGSR